MPLPEKLDNVPPVTKMSAKAKSVDASLRVNVRVAVPLAAKLVLSAVTSMVGAVVSGGSATVNATVLLVSAPSVFGLPAASVNAPLATETLAAVTPESAVNVAV